MEPTQWSSTMKVAYSLGDDTLSVVRRLRWRHRQRKPCTRTAARFGTVAVAGLRNLKPHLTKTAIAVFPGVSWTLQSTFDSVSLPSDVDVYGGAWMRMIYNTASQGDRSRFNVSVSWWRNLLQLRRCTMTWGSHGMDEQAVVSCSCLI